MFFGVQPSDRVTSNVSGLKRKKLSDVEPVNLSGGNGTEKNPGEIYDYSGYNTNNCGDIWLYMVIIVVIIVVNMVITNNSGCSTNNSGYIYIYGLYDGIYDLLVGGFNLPL